MPPIFSQSRIFSFSTISKALSFILTVHIFYACLPIHKNRIVSKEAPLPNTYKKIDSYYNPLVSFSNFKKLALLKPENFTNDLNIAESIYHKVKSKLEFLGYSVIPYSEISRLAVNKGVKPVNLFHPPYVRETVRKLGVSAFIICALVDYQCSEFSKKNEDFECSFAFVMRMSDIKKGSILWVGSSSFRNVLKDIIPVFNKHLKTVLNTIPPLKKPPKHPLEMKLLP